MTLDKVILSVVNVFWLVLFACSLIVAGLSFVATDAPPLWQSLVVGSLAYLAACATQVEIRARG